MRRLADRGRILRFLRAAGAAADRDGRLYLTGGATAVLLGWRAATIDVDILLVPDQDSVFRAIPDLKERLDINVELASPADFIPEVPGWQDRSVHVGREGRLDAFHYDLHAQALAKIERGHVQDAADVEEMLRRGLVEPSRLLELFAAIEPAMYRYPALDPPSFRRAVERTVSGWTGGRGVGEPSRVRRGSLRGRSRAGGRPKRSAPGRGRRRRS
jgi:hypothetical protein